MTMLAGAEHENVKSDCLAGSVNTNPVVIRRVLGQLAHANLVVSHTGAAGGTRLARDPEDIKLADIYKAVSCGEVFALHPKGANKDCPIGRGVETVLCNLQKEIDRAVSGKLSEYSLQDVIGMIEQGKD